MKVRISKTPVQREVDGVRLDRLRPGSVREVPSSLATWLIVEGYAEPEMRRVPRDSDMGIVGGSNEFSFAHDRRRRS
jgi:hypothetical protein